MSIFFHNPSRKRQYFIAVLAVCGVAGIGLAIYDFAGYRVTAFLLLVTVSVLAMFCDIVPVLLAAALSALTWDFLFIPPRFTFTVGTSEDQLLLLMYFIIAMINAVLTSKMRQMEKEMRLKEEKEKAARFYNTLLTSLSHELRTPITAIIGAVDNLEQSPRRLNSAEIKELHNEIATAAVRLNQQVENLLRMSRLESGAYKIKPDWCDVRELIYIALKHFDAADVSRRVNIFVPDHFPLFRLDLVS